MRPLVLALATFVVSACSDATSDGAAESMLIGGESAPEGTFPSTLEIIGGCTGTKVGEHHILTAGHCVRTPTGQLRPELAEGRTILVRLRNGELDASSLTIRRTVLHPRIPHLCQAQPCGNTAAFDRRDAPDIAIVEVESGLEGIPIAAVDVEPARPGDEVTILGYGCQSDIFADDRDGRLRFRQTRLVSSTATLHPGGLAPSESGALAMLDGNYVFTPGPVAPPGAPAETHAGLCPGDSGGALYRKGKNVVVGVNASYTFRPNGVVPVSNWHARVDGESRWGSAAWLESRGVMLTGSCAAAACTPVRSE